MIKAGLTLRETVVPDGPAKPGEARTQNPSEVAPTSNGTFIDVVGRGEFTERPFDGNNQADVNRVNSIIGTALSQPVSERSIQTLQISVPGCGVVLTATTTHTVSNIDPQRPGQVAPFGQPPNVTPNYNIRVEARSGPVSTTTRKNR